MPTIYFQATHDQSDPSPYILKSTKKINPALADNLFGKMLYETHKKDIPALIDFHYKRCDEPSEFADHVTELLEVALDEGEEVIFLKSLSFWGDPEIVQEIETRLSICDKLKEDIRETLKKSEALRQSIRKQAFEGKLLNQVEPDACRQKPDWEPAEQLLDRIKQEKKK